MKFSSSQIQPLQELLAKPQKVVILSHRNPDGDALGSSLAWKFFLEQINHTATYISPNACSANLKWIPGTDTILAYENDTEKKKCDHAIKEAELIFCLDFNALSRLESLGEVIRQTKAIKVIIDHHQQPEQFAQLTFSNTAYCSTAEMVYDIIADLELTRLIDEKIAELLYIGLATDSGFFQFNNATVNAHQVAAALLAKGVRPDYISEKVNNNFRETRLRFFGYCLNEKLKLIKNGQVAYMLVTQQEIKKFNLQAGDSEGLVNYPFKIEGVMLSVYFSEEPDRIKISFRSRGAIDVNNFARTYFEGGGHFNAAGGKSKIGPEKTEQKFLEAIETLNFL